MSNPNDSDIAAPAWRPLPSLLIRREDGPVSRVRLPKEAPRHRVPESCLGRICLAQQRPYRRPCPRSEEHTSELQSRQYLVCRLLLEKKKKKLQRRTSWRRERHE